MARTPIVSRDQVPAKYQQAFDSETANSNGVISSGPGSVMINSPEMRKRANHLVEWLREESSIPKKLQELAMLIVARSTDCKFIWNAHAARGRMEGLSDDLVDAIRDRKPLPAALDDEAVVISYGTEFFQTRQVSQATFDAALTHFGATGLTELTTLMGYYALLAFNANAFQIDLPEGRTEAVLPV